MQKKDIRETQEHIRGKETAVLGKIATTIAGGKDPWSFLVPLADKPVSFTGLGDKILRGREWTIADRADANRVTMLNDKLKKIPRNNLGQESMWPIIDEIITLAARHGIFCIPYRQEHIVENCSQEGQSISCLVPVPMLSGSPTIEEAAEVFASALSRPEEECLIRLSAVTYRENASWPFYPEAAQEAAKAIEDYRARMARKLETAKGIPGILG